METLLLEFGLKDGIFVAMFIWLLIYVLNTSRERENKLYSFLDGMKMEFAKLVSSYESLAKDVGDLKQEFTEIKEQNKKGES